MKLITPTHNQKPDRAEKPEKQESCLQIRNLTVNYNGDPALEDINFDVYPGESIAVIGPNGAGKSTLMKAIMGLIPAIKRGQVHVAGKGADRLGYVPQQNDVNWDFPVTVQDVVMMGLIRQIGWMRWPRKKHHEQVDAALNRVGLGEFSHRHISELSGGQQRRVFIARALAQQSDILLLDEPFAGVDAGAQAELMDVIDKLHSEGITILFTTHDLGLAFSRFDKVAALRHRLIAYGDVSAVYTPEILSHLYGGRLAAWDEGRQVMIFVDDHACTDC